MTVAAPQHVTLCQVTDLPVGLGRAFLVGDKKIAVFRSRSGQVFAMDNVCPHRGGPLADGMMVGNQVVCPLHAYRFAGASGACEQTNICPVPTYTVEVSDGVVRLA